MAKPHSIRPFPADIDRDAFGHWLAGFTDGEGCFMAAFGRGGRNNRPTGKTNFQICLRGDDSQVLQLTQSFLRCGRLYRKQGGLDQRNGKPRSEAVSFQVSKLDDLLTIVIPTFERFPLRAKKQRDFVVWIECVRFCRQVSHRANKRRDGGSRGGWTDRWLKADLEHFAKLAATLRKQREMTTVEQLLAPAGFQGDDEGFWPLFEGEG